MKVPLNNDTFDLIQIDSSVEMHHSRGIKSGKVVAKEVNGEDEKIIWVKDQNGIERGYSAKFDHSLALFEVPALDFSTSSNVDNYNTAQNDSGMLL